jgi:hypothetical protein
VCTVTAGGSDPDADHWQELAQPHGGGQAARAEGEGEGDDALEAQSKLPTARAAPVIPEWIPSSESGNHRVLRKLTRGGDVDRPRGGSAMVSQTGYRCLP